jgi:putative SOS response-associated peptidase YedK
VSALKIVASSGECGFKPFGTPRTAATVRDTALPCFPAEPCYVLDMCGRARLSSDVSEIKIAFAIPPLRPAPNFAASWNVAPTDPLPIVRYDAKEHQRSLEVMRWGLVPFWAKDIEVGFAKKVDGGKQPYAIGLKGGGLMALAGLWESWRSRSSGERVRSFAIVTTEPNELCAALHNRMPVVLAPEAWPHGSVKNRRTRRI